MHSLTAVLKGRKAYFYFNFFILIISFTLLCCLIFLYVFMFFVNDNVSFFDRTREDINYWYRKYSWQHNYTTDNANDNGDTDEDADVTMNNLPDSQIRADAEAKESILMERWISDDGFSSVIINFFDLLEFSFLVVK